MGCIIIMAQSRRAAEKKFRRLLERLFGGGGCHLMAVRGVHKRENDEFLLLLSHHPAENQKVRINNRLRFNWRNVPNHDCCSSQVKTLSHHHLLFGCGKIDPSFSSFFGENSARIECWGSPFPLAKKRFGESRMCLNTGALLWPSHAAAAAAKQSSLFIAVLIVKRERPQLISIYL